MDIPNEGLPDSTVQRTGMGPTYRITALAGLRNDTLGINAQRDMLLVAQASTGRQAIEYFRKHKADVILTELRRPDTGGIELMIAKVAASGKPSGRKNQSDPESEETTWQA